MKQDISNGMKLVSASLDLMQMFLIINKDGMKVNEDMNSKN